MLIENILLWLDRIVGKPVLPPDREFSIASIEHKNPFWIRMHNLYWELKLGICTRGVVYVKSPIPYLYSTMRYVTINRILRFLQLQPSDVFVDIGSGKGRILCCAARLELRSVAGVELSDYLCKIARSNIDSMRGRKTPVVVHNVLAQDFDFPDGTVFMFFNPFDQSTLINVLERLEASVKSHPRPIRVVYANPAYDFVFENLSWLEKYEYWEKEELGIEHSVSFYRSR